MIRLLLIELLWLSALCCVPGLAKAQEPIPADTLISLQRGNCDVKGCPIYRLVIFANGDVIWQGRGRVARLGVRQSRIEAGQLRRLIGDFEATGYFGLEDIYGFHGKGCQSSRPYSPVVMTSFSMGGHSRTISHHLGCVGEMSDRLTALENEIDEVANTRRWIGGRKY